MRHGALEAISSFGISCKKLEVSPDEGAHVRGRGCERAGRFSIPTTGAGEAIQVCSRSHK